MKTFYFLVLFCFSATLKMAAQTNFRVEVRYDTVGLNEQFEVKFILENADMLAFTAPDFSGFTVAGPSTNTSMSIINGKTSRSVAYCYYLQAKEIGEFEILAASAKTKEGTLHTSPLHITVKEYVEYSESPSMRANPNNPYSFSPFGEGGDFFGNDFNSLFKQMPDMNSMMRQWEQLFQMPQTPQTPAKKAEKTYKL